MIELHNRNIKILVAPNSYKECASSTVAAELITKELARNGFMAVTAFPLSDGGDGFLEVCRRIFNLHLLPFEIKNCHDKSKSIIQIGYEQIAKTMYVEVADIVGLKNIPFNKRKPTILNTKNIGELLRHITDGNLEIKKIIIGIGGTGINDLGLGLCAAYGMQMFDADGNELEMIPLNYSRATKIVLPQKLDIPIEVILDVEIPLYGETGTSKIFAGQKGAGVDDIDILEQGVINVLGILERDHELQFKNKRIGAGGGISLGLSLIADVCVTRSQQFLMETLRLGEKINECDVVITGEGKFDEQSFMNKATGIVIKEAQKKNKKIILLVGSSDLQSTMFKNNAPLIFEFRSLFTSTAQAMEYFDKGISLGIEHCFGTTVSQATKISKPMLLM